MKSNPLNYKTQRGVIAALTRAADLPMTVQLAWWLKTAEHSLVRNFGWTEPDAARFVAAYHPRRSAYKATA